MRLTRENHDGECQEIIDVVLGSDAAADIDWQTLIELLLRVAPLFMTQGEPQ